MGYFGCWLMGMDVRKGEEEGEEGNEGGSYEI